MDIATRMYRKLVDLRLDFLEEQKEVVLQSLGDYIDKVIVKGRAWIDDESQSQSTFLQVSQMIDSAANFLTLKHHEIKDVSEGMVFLEPLMSPEAPQDSTQWTKSSHLSVASAVARCHSADEQLAQHRCDLMEQSIATLHTSTEKVKGAQDDLTKQFKQLDEILSDVVSKQTMFENTQSAQFNEDQKRAEKLANEQTHIVKQQELKIDNVETQLEILYSKINQLEELHSSRNEDNDEIKSKIDMINVHLEIMKNQSDPLSSAIDDTSMTVWNLSNKTEAVEELLRDLSQKVSSNKQTLQLISARQEQFAQTVKKLEDLSLEVVSRQDLEIVEKQVKETNDNYKMLCVMLNKRLQPLEKLRNCLNSKVQARDEHAGKLLDVTRRLDLLTSQVSVLELDRF